MKTLKSITILLGVSALSLTFAVAQSNQVDPGISTHNYKHPNKAKLAKKQNQGNTITVVSNQQSKTLNNMPKYASRPASLVVETPGVGNEAHINPLVAERNYKTSKASTTRAMEATATRSNSNIDSTTID
jgi:hypothetical protein